MKGVILSLVVVILSTPLFAQSVRFSIDDVTVRQSSSGVTFEGLRSPEGTIPRLVLESTLPAVDRTTRMLIGGSIVDKLISPPTVRSFVGSIEGDPESNVAITYVDSDIFGLVQQGDGTTWVLTRDLKEQSYTIASGTNAFTPPDCGFRDEGVLRDHKSASAASAEGGLKELELAVETDTEFFKSTGGSEEKATSYLTALMSTVSSLYQREIGVVIKIVWARIWTDEPSDPYGVKGNPFALSDSVRANWESYADVERDLFHIITAAPGGGGGYAFPDAVCRTDQYAHGATSVQGWNDLSAPGFNYDTYIVSHEIGHNFNARHTHGCYYGAPLDTCEVEQGINEGCLEQGQQKLPNPGSIMSYCGWTNLDANGSYTVEMSFRDIVKSGIREFAGSLDCLSDVQLLPAVSIVSPDGDTLGAGSITLRWASLWSGEFDLEMRGDHSLGERVSGQSYTLDLPMGRYEWRVRTVESGETGEWSSWGTITISGDITGVEETFRLPIRMNLW